VGKVYIFCENTNGIKKSNVCVFINIDEYFCEYLCEIFCDLCVEYAKESRQHFCQLYKFMT
jgi:hypothetical protein